MTAKYEWRKAERKFYLPKSSPAIVEVPVFSFLSLNGQGDPNGEEFALKVEALYAISYAIKMLPKKSYIPEGYFEYTVFPLEAVWSVEELSNKLDKEKFIYTVMIRQLDFVNEKVIARAVDLAKSKIALAGAVKFETINEGLCVQMLHCGSYDDEEHSFKLMDQFCTDNKLCRISAQHREIYLNDPRKTQPDKLKTVLRYAVKR